jgi:signal transduction histidine kinase
VVLALSAALLSGLYLVLRARLADPGAFAALLPAPLPAGPGGELVRVPFDQEAFLREQFQRAANFGAMVTIRQYALWALGALSVISLGAGWFISGQVLKPIDRIRAVADQIRATDLSRRIELQGPDDELRRLAATFDGMLDRLEDAWTAQQQFLADASHELRNPLAVIRANVDRALANPGPGGEHLQRAAEVTQRTTERMTDLVNDLLALARGQDATGSRAPVDLAVLVAETVEELRAAARADLRVRVSRVPPVRGDATALQRAVANLVDNAVRHSPPGGVVEVTVEGDDQTVRVLVADQGPGVAPEHAEHLFRRFYRADDSRARAGGGAGLGLAIVRQIAEAHGGTVRLASPGGPGATFVIQLPAASDAALTAPEARRAGV